MYHVFNLYNGRNYKRNMSAIYNPEYGVLLARNYKNSHKIFVCAEVLLKTFWPSDLEGNGT